MNLKLLILIIVMMFLIPLVNAVSNVACGQVLLSSITMNDSIFNCPVDGLFINASDVTLDCAGFTINQTGATGRGIQITNLADNTIIQNCNVEGFFSGIGAMSEHRIPNDNLTGVTIRNYNWDSEDEGILVQNIGQGDRNINWTIQDISGISSNSGIELNLPIDFLIERMNFTCDGSCQSGIFTQQIEGLNNVIRDVIFLEAIDNVLEIENGFLFQGFSAGVNAIVLVEDFFVEGFGAGLLSEDGNITLRRGKIKSDSIAIEHGGNTDFTFVENVSYPDTNISNSVTGIIFRSWDSTVRTNIPDVDINLSSNQAVVTNSNTGINGSVTINLLEYELNGSLVKTDSTPYNVTAIFGSQSFEGTLILGSLLNNSIEFNQFTVSVPAITGAVIFPLENASSLVGMVALFIIIFGLIFSRGISRRR